MKLTDEQVEKVATSAWDGRGWEGSPVPRATAATLVALATEVQESRKALKTVACAFCGHETERTADAAETFRAVMGHMAACDKHPAGIMLQVSVALALLLKRADECCRMIPPPDSDPYTNGLQADIAAAAEDLDKVLKVMRGEREGQ